MSKFELVKGYFDCGLWGEKRIHDAVGKGWITAEQYRQITGEDYPPAGDE